MNYLYTTTYGRVMLVCVSQKVIEKLQEDRRTFTDDLPRHVEQQNYNQVNYSTKNILLIDKQVSAYQDFIEYLNRLSMDNERRKPLDIILIADDPLFRRALVKYIECAQKELIDKLDRTLTQCTIEASFLRGILIALSVGETDPQNPPAPDIVMRHVAQALAQARKDLE